MKALPSPPPREWFWQPAAFLITKIDGARESYARSSSRQDLAGLAARIRSGSDSRQDLSRDDVSAPAAAKVLF